MLGIIGGIVLFGDPLGTDPAMVVGRLLAFTLVLSAVARAGAIRAHQAVRTNSSGADPKASSAAPA